MTLAQRILLAIAVVVVLATGALSFAVQRTWEATAQEQFVHEFQLATTRLRQQLTDEVAQLPVQLTSLCEHSQMVDSTLTALQAGSLDRERKYALSLLVPATQRAFGFDELLLVTSSGEILGAHQPGLIGRIDRELGARARSEAHSELRSVNGQWRIDAHCRKAATTHAVALFATRYLDSILERVGALHGLDLSHEPPAERPERFVRTLTLPELRGAALYATPKRVGVDEAMAELELRILEWGALVLLVALGLGFWFARRLARPIVELSQQARRVVEGDPQPIRARGGSELREFAQSFNQTLDDLVRLRRRVAAIERIAAQREIARRVAHEIRNPLAPIRAAIETLRRLRARHDPAFDDYFDEATRTVLSEVRRITTIVEEFTEFARFPPPSPECFELEPVLRSVVQLHQREGVSLELDVVGPTSIRADRDQCVQVVTNLILNALDAVANTPQACVQVGLEATGDHIRLWVDDNGPGLDEPLRSRVWNPYVTTKPGGTGLGLAIVQRIVVEHGGETSVGSSPLGGARFVVTLPVDGPAEVLDARSDSVLR